MGVGNTNYPTTLDTAVDLVEAANRSFSTLSTGIDNNPATTTIPLVSASTFTTSGIVAIDDEIISYTGKSGNSLTGAVRAFEGTTIASHNAGAAVRQLITAASHNVQSTAIIALETKLGTGTDIAWTQMTPLSTNRVAVSDGSGDIAASPITHDSANGIVGNVGGIDFDTTPSGANAAARLIWDDTDGTLAVTLKGGNVLLPLGQRDITRVVNKTGSNVLASNYQVVRASQAQGQRLGVSFAQGNSEPNSTDVLGLVSENISVNQEGFVTTRGVIGGINTTGSLQGETWADGDVLYVSPVTAGGLTKTKPQAPNHLILAGYVVYAHQNNGKIFVAIQTSWETAELHDVKITGTPVAGSLLIRNATTGVWENATLTAGSNISITNADKSITIATTGTGDVTGPASSTDTAIARFSGTTGKVIQNSLIGIDSTGALGLPDNVRQTFNPGSTTPGLNVGANSGDPSTPSNGDIWYNSATSGTGNRQFRMRRNGVTSSVAIVPPSVTAEREIPTINPSTGNLDNVGELFYISADNALKVGDVGTGRLQLNAITTETPQVQATGVDTNINLNLVSKGTGTVQANGVPIVTTSGSQALTNKTINGSNNTITNVSLTTGVTGTLPSANGGTGQSTYTAGQLLIGNNAGGLTKATLTAGSNVTITSGDGAITIAATGGGGGGVTSFSAGTTGLTPSSNTTGAVTLAGTLNVANGGTGSSSLTANNVLLGNGTNAVQVVAPGTAGNVLTSNGTTWSSQPGTFGIVRTTGGISLNASSPPEVFLTDNTVNVQTVTLPDVTAAGFTVGRRFTITNESAAAGQVLAFGSVITLSFIVRGQRVVATCISTANNNASSWYIAYDNFLLNPAGAENYLINSAFRVDQRLGGASRTVTTGSFQFVADRWQAQALGASVSVSATALSGLGGLRVIGAAGNTGTQLRQRIEQRIINNLNDDQLASRTVTLSFEHFTLPGVPTTYSYAINYASSGDNFSTTTAGPTGNMISQPVSNSSLLRVVSGPIIISSSAGIEVIITLPALTAAQDITIRNIKLEPGNVPTPYVSVPFDVELQRCLRYYEIQRAKTDSSTGVLGIASVYSANVAHLFFDFTPKRATPTFTTGGLLQLLSAGGAVNITAASVSEMTAFNGLVSLTTTSATQGAAAIVRTQALNSPGTFTFDAEL